MSYSRANVEGRAALVADGQWYDLESLSGGEPGSDPMAALSMPDDLITLTAELPLVFTKLPSCLVGPVAEVERRSDAVDYEGELVGVIGPGGKDIEPDDAWDHIVGLTVGQDISDRAVQFAAQPPHFDLGKSFGPIGPTPSSPSATACSTPASTSPGPSTGVPTRRCYGEDRPAVDLR